MGSVVYKGDQLVFARKGIDVIQTVKRVDVQAILEETPAIAGAVL